MIFQFRRELAGAIGLLALAQFARKKDRMKSALPLGAAALALMLLPRPLTGLKGKSVVITGGSRGLGLAFAKILMEKGASVTLLARDPDELDSATAILCGDPKKRPGHLFTVVCDVTKCENLDRSFAEARAKFGKIDLLINNAGAISVGPFATLENEDFGAQLRLHLQAVIDATRLIRPYFHQNGGGRIINISSIGGAVPMPHMASYCASKFALAGFSEAISAELKQENILVTTAYPGLMRTGSPIQAVFKGDHEKEFAWFAASDNAPFLSVSADRAAAEILGASLSGRHQIVVSLPAKLGVLAHALLPETYLNLLDIGAKFLPKGLSRERRTGAEARASGLPFERRMQDAQEKFNQSEKRDADYNLGIRSQGPLVQT